MIESVKFTEGRGYVSKNENTKECLLNKEIKFSKDKINIIFGRNGSGKSTILKTIAGHCFVKDGFLQRHEIRDWSFKKEGMLEKLKKEFVTNESEIKMNGAPLYYHNFKEKSHGSSVGDLCGGMIDSIKTELAFVMQRQSRSEGETRMTELDLVVEALTKMKGKSMEDLLMREENFIGMMGSAVRQVFDENRDEHVVLRDYFSKLDGYKEKEMTVLLDEYDENLDVNYAFNILDDFLPKLQKELNAQIILSTHNPMVLADRFYNSDRFNIISLWDEYTEGCRDFLYKLFQKKGE